MKTYGPYGKLVASSGSATSPIGFAGAYTDPDGLLYLVNRYYDPKTGQFLSVDPLVALTGEPYGYAGDNPLLWADPLGLNPLNPCNWGNVCHHLHNVADGARHAAAASADVVRRHGGATIEVIGGVACVVVSDGVCIGALIAGGAGDLLQHNDNGTLTSQSVDQTIAVTGVAVATAGMGSLYKSIADTALPLSSTGEAANLADTTAGKAGVRGLNALAGTGTAIPAIQELENPCP